MNQYIIVGRVESDHAAKILYMGEDGTDLLRTFERLKAQGEYAELGFYTLGPDYTRGEDED